MNKKKPQLNKEDFVLYILNRVEPNKNDKIRLNKLAFFVEFAYLLNFGDSLSNTEYAAIDMGPVIDGYDALLKDMQKRKLITVDGYIIRPLKSPSKKISQEASSFIDGVIDKYSRLTKSELIGLSHLTDAYKITTDNERVMGNIINKKLALLETFLVDSENGEGFCEDELPEVDRAQLVSYVTE